MSDFVKKYGPWALITGATSGTGLQFAHILAEKGLNLLLIARGEQALDDTKKSIQDRYKVDVMTFSADLSNPDSPAAIENAAKGLEIGLLINNAGFSITGEFHKNGLDEQSKLIEAILRAPMALTHAFCQDMIKRGHGGIILVSSSVAYTPAPLWSAYSAGKAALLSFGESLSQELKKYGVDVLTVCPGAMRTKFQERSGIKSQGAMEPDRVAKLTIQSLGTAVSLVPGLTNKIVFKGIGRLLPVRFRLTLFEKVMRKIQIRTPG